MMAQQTVYHPTPSQFASAATHLETPIHHIRIDGQRFAIVTSGNSDHVYWLPADGTSCPCVWWETTRTTCSHLLAVELDALEQELAEAPLMADLYRRCARVGCGALTEGTTLCDECSAIQERSERMAAARARVLEAWI